MLPIAPVPRSHPELAGGQCRSFPLRAQPSGGELSQTAASGGCSPALPSSPGAGRECAFPQLAWDVCVQTGEVALPVLEVETFYRGVRVTEVAVCVDMHLTQKQVFIGGLQRSNS